MNLDDLIHLSADEIVAIHDDILNYSSGLKGSRADLSISAIVSRIHNNLLYSQVSGIEEIAALYAEAIAKGHVFNDGNKRTAVVSMLTFLDLNGYSITVDQKLLADKIVDLASGHLNYKALSVWLKGKLS